MDIRRCSWVDENNQLYKDYHDNEWGVPVYDDNKIFEFLILEGAQAGLSWLIILKKREAYRLAFSNFDPIKVAKYKNNEINSLMENNGLIRNRSKLEAALNNARHFLEIKSIFGSFSQYQWQFVDHKVIKNSWTETKTIPSYTDKSIEFSQDLKKRGFRFVGPTILYAHMQATGMVNDHTVDCFRYQQINNLSA